MTFLPFSSPSSSVLFCLLHRSSTTDSLLQALPHLPPLFACRRWHIYSEFSSRSEQRGREMIVGDGLRREGCKRRAIERLFQGTQTARLRRRELRGDGVEGELAKCPSCYFSLNNAGRCLLWSPSDHEFLKSTAAANTYCQVCPICWRLRPVQPSRPLPVPNTKASHLAPLWKIFGAYKNK